MNWKYFLFSFPSIHPEYLLWGHTNAIRKYEKAFWMENCWRFSILIDIPLRRLLHNLQSTRLDKKYYLTKHETWEKMTKQKSRNSLTFLWISHLPNELFVTYFLLGMSKANNFTQKLFLFQFRNAPQPQ